MLSMEDAQRSSYIFFIKNIHLQTEVVGIMHLISSIVCQAKRGCGHSYCQSLHSVPS